jgi:nanoRNase/pAp phosphatase (c-di-AMP/oligoRNAs hydrolase)
MGFNLDFNPDELRLDINSGKKKDVKNLLISAKKACIILSRRLDDDNIASAILLAEFLEKRTTEVVKIYSCKELPEKFSDLHGVERVEIANVNVLDFGKFDAVVLLDGGNLSQFYDPGVEPLPDYKAIKDRLVSIDHHEGNEKFTDNLILNSKASSTVEVLYENKLMDIDDFNEDQAELAYSGMADDTGNFKFAVTSQTFKIAEKLLSKGVNIERVCHRLFYNVPLDAMRIAQYIFKNAEFDLDTQSSFAFLNEEEVEKLEMSRRFIGEGVRFYVEDISYTADKTERGFVFFRDDHRLKMSARGDNFTNKIDLSQLGVKIGGSGGGHFNASGFSFDLRDFKGMQGSSDEEIKTYFFNKLKTEIKNRID